VRRRWLALPIAAAAATITVIAVTSHQEALAWTATPHVVMVPDLPQDRVLTGEIVNTTDKPIYVDAREIVVLDASGHRLDTAARFLSSFVHPLYAPFQFPGTDDRAGDQRLGISVRIDPGQRLPLTVSWRLAAGDHSPTRVDLGVVSLPLPAD
jgi:rhodanese-related sulfurtransferase